MSSNTFNQELHPGLQHLLEYTGCSAPGVLGYVRWVAGLPCGDTAVRVREFIYLPSKITFQVLRYKTRLRTDIQAIYGVV